MTRQFPPLRVPILVLLVFVAAGCATRPDRIVLLPGSTGNTGAVFVHSAKGEQVLDTPYASLDVTKNGKMQTGTESEASVKARYGDLLEARPPRPVNYTVRFTLGSATELTPDSAEVIAAFRKALASWPAPQVTVTGHTDRTGTSEANDKLSLQRARTVADFLMAQGVSSQHIEIVGRGDREPLVMTERGVPNERNRRVEISIR